MLLYSSFTVWIWHIPRCCNPFTVNLLKETSCFHFILRQIQLKNREKKTSTLQKEDTPLRVFLGKLLHWKQTNRSWSFLKFLGILFALMDLQSIYNLFHRKVQCGGVYNWFTTKNHCHQMENFKAKNRYGF